MELTITRDKERLAELEGVIQRNLQSFYEVGRALMEIRNRELYKIKNGGGYQTFEEYCRGVWDLSRPRAYQLIDAAEVKTNLSTVVDIPIPERQIRPLTRLEPEKQKEAWIRAVETAPEGKVTAAHVQKVVREMVEPPAPKARQQEIKVEFTNAMLIATFAISHLERIRKDDPKHDEALDYVAAWIAKQRGGPANNQGHGNAAGAL